MKDMPETLADVVYRNRNVLRNMGYTLSMKYEIIQCAFFVSEHFSFCLQLQSSECPVSMYILHVTVTNYKWIIHIK